MKKLMIFMTMILVSGLLMAETGMYPTSIVPGFLPTGLNCVGQVMMPYWANKKMDINYFQECGYYDMRGNLHLGKGRPKDCDPAAKEGVFHEYGPINNLPGKTAQDKKIEKMLKWIIVKMCEIYFYRIPRFI